MTVSAHDTDAGDNSPDEFSCDGIARPERFTVADGASPNEFVRFGS
jgi:hypothetical protein